MTTQRETRIRCSLTAGLFAAVDGSPNTGAQSSTLSSEQGRKVCRRNGPTRRLGGSPGVVCCDKEGSSMAQTGPWTGDPVWLADVLRAEGIDLVEYPGWRNRGHGDFK